MKLQIFFVKQIHNVMYVPSIKKNIMLFYTIIDQCLKVEFVNPDCVVNDMQYHFNFFVVGVIFGGLYNLYVIRKIHQLFASTTVTMQVLWHQRYDHINCHDLLLIQKQ